MSILANLALPRNENRGKVEVLNNLVSWNMTGFDFSSLSAIERIALAEALYDNAMREIEAAAPKLTPEQLAEIDRRIAQVEAGTVELPTWDNIRTDGQTVDRLLSERR